MAVVREIAARDDGTPASIELVDDGADERVVVAPGRGGIVWSWRVRGREIFYLDAETLRDSTKNVRGGNPVLFPTPGKLTGDAWSRGGRSGTLKQHGFGRNLAWRTAETSAKDGASVTIALASTDTTRAAYPWDFDASLTYTARGTSLHTLARVTNRSPEPMPFGLGFHPYFAVTDKAAARIPSSATRAFDNVTKKEIAFSGFDLAHGEVDMHLHDHGATTAELVWGARDGGGKLVVRGSAEVTHWVVWTLPGRDFVCLEPWTCPGDALNTGDRLLFVEPGATREVTVEYEYVPA